MSDIKEKAKNLWENHKADIIAFGSIVVVSIGSGAIIYKAYKDGFVDGGMTGFHLTLDWLDKNFPGESNARELWERYKIENPDKIVYRKGPGKWSH